MAASRPSFVDINSPGRDRRGGGARSRSPWALYLRNVHLLGLSLRKVRRRPLGVALQIPGAPPPEQAADQHGDRDELKGEFVVVLVADDPAHDPRGDGVAK